MTATDELRRLLDERGVEYRFNDATKVFEWHFDGTDGEGSAHATEVNGGVNIIACSLTPEQVIAATLGRRTWVDPAWEHWHKSLRHDEIKSIGDAVEQLMYEAIEFGGDMGPNGNTYNGIDEGDVLTSGFINEWVARFESTLGRDRYSYEQLREISNAVGNAMEYAHDKAIEHPDDADPLWNLDEYVNRILRVAFEGGATLGVTDATSARQGDASDAKPTQAESSGTCEMEYVSDWMSWHCKACDQMDMAPRNPKPRYCKWCGRKVVDDG